MNYKFLLPFLILLGVVSTGLKAQFHPGDRPVTYHGENVKLSDFFMSVWQQTMLRAFYNDEQLSSESIVTVKVEREPLDNVLASLLRKRGLTWYYREETFVILPKKPGQPDLGELPEEAAINVTGRVTNKSGVPLQNASVLVRGTRKGSNTDEAGKFTLRVKRRTSLIISCIGYSPKEIQVKKDTMSVQLEEAVTGLDEVMVIAYGTSTRRNLTGSVSRVSAADIAQQPVADPLLAMQGRVPGLAITQLSGLPGGEIKVELRGRNSIAAGNEPLYIVDGVPFPGSSLSFNTLQNGTSISPLGASNPLNMINIADIESIEVLKDADATAIYGSRGANGVLLISTKRPKIGKMKMEANLYTGIGKMAHGIAYLDTRRYLQMRKDAFANDGASPHTSDYDLMSWDSSRYTDWQRVLLGGTAHINDGQLALNAGNNNVQLRLSGGYRRESTIYPGSFAYQKASGRLSFILYSPDQKTRAQFSAAYVADQNHLPYLDLAQFVSSPPNTPEPYTPSGQLNWEDGNFDNPLSYGKRLYKGNTNNLLSSLVISRELFKGLQLKASLGYNKMGMDEKQPNSFRNLNPAYGFGTTTGGYTYFANGSMKSWIAEPQLLYQGQWRKLAIDMVLGATFQQDTREQQGYLGYGFSSDAPAQLENMAAATTVNQQGNFYYQYRYNALFGRINLNWKQQYILNLTGRRDGSSRFGPGNQFANFGAIGAAWIFSKAPWIQQSFPLLSFGKLRASYGSTGNDQIRDYGYYTTYMPSLIYGDQRGQWPTRLFNPNYGWELSKKLELGLELGFLADRFLLRTGYYSNRSSNQLVNYSLSAVTGFPSILDNLPAVVANTGWELELNAQSLKTENFSWSSAFNISFPRNELKAFPNIQTSAYNNSYTVGQPLNIKKGYQYLGVDPVTGRYHFSDANKDGKLNPADYISHTQTGIRFFGGLQNSIRYKGWNLDFLFQFVKQHAYNYLFSNSVPPGIAFANQPAAIWERWQAAGDQRSIQLFTQGPGPANDAYLNAPLSNAAICDASYIRLKNINFSYSLPGRLLEKWQLQQVKCYLQGQNLLTLTSYKGRDPETATNREVYPPLRVWTLGLQLGF